MHKVILTLFLVFLLIHWHKAAYVKLTNAVCESKNQSWVNIDYCRLRAISRNRTDLTVEVTVYHPAKIIHVGIKMEKKANGYKPWLFDFKVDACAFVRKANNPAVKLLFEIVKPFTNIVHPCPYVGKYFIRNFHYDPSNLTLPVPTGDYRFLMSWSFERKVQFTSDVYFHFEQDIGKD